MCLQSEEQHRFGERLAYALEAKRELAECDKLAQVRQCNNLSSSHWITELCIKSSLRVRRVKVHPLLLSLVMRLL